MYVVGQGKTIRQWRVMDRGKIKQACYRRTRILQNIKSMGLTDGCAKVPEFTVRSHD